MAACNSATWGGSGTAIKGCSCTDKNLPPDAVVAGPLELGCTPIRAHWCNWNRGRRQLTGASPGTLGLRVLLVERSDFLEPHLRNAGDPLGRFLYHVVRNRDRPLSF